jgi:DNA-binding Lrp family transcriptional regulator
LLLNYLLDDLDLRIIYLFANNSRMSYRSIASDIGLTSKSAKARIDKMISSNIIQSFNVIVNPIALGCNKVCILRGRCGNKTNEGDIRKKIDQLGNLMIRVQHLGRWFEYGFSVEERFNDEIKLLVDLVGPEVTYRIFQIKPFIYHDLSESDLKIIKCLLFNPRMDISHIAGQISISGKTVTRRLNMMIQNQILRFSVLCDSASTFGYMQFVLTLRVQESRYNYIYEYMCAEFRTNIFYAPRSFTNPPNELRFYLFSENLSTIESILVKVESIKGVESTELFVIIKVEHYTDWITKEIDQRLVNKQVVI